MLSSEKTIKNSADDDLNEMLEDYSDSFKRETSRRTGILPPANSGYFDEEDSKLGKACESGYKQWTTSDGVIFLPASNTSEVLVPGVYDIKHSERIGIFFEKIPVRTEGLIEFPNTTFSKVIVEIQKFWELEKTFKDFGMAYKRGILLYGSPGGGKSSLIQIITRSIIESKKGIVFNFDNPKLFKEGLRVFRKIQPNTPIVVLMEDIDSIIEDWSESLVLNILDGVEAIHNCIFLSCFTPDTRLLTKDFRWVPAGDIKAGDILQGFDENRSERLTKTGKETARKYCTSIVISSFEAVKECVRVHLDTGESFVCTSDHPWLSSGANESCGRNLEWTLAENLLERPNLVRPFIPWETDNSWEAGWFAGILDGEGFIRKSSWGRPSGIGIAQVVGDIANEIARVSKKFGNFEMEVRDPGHGHQIQNRFRSKDGFPSAVSILGRVQSKRLIKKFNLDGMAVQSRHDAKVIKIEKIGLQKIQSIETSSKTYFAEGFAVHNTTNYPGKLGARIVNRPSRFDKRFNIGFLDEDCRKLYFERTIPEDVIKSMNIDLNKWVLDTKNFSIAHLKELFIAVVILGDDYEEAIKTLKSMKETPDSKNKSESQSFGFGR